MNSQRRRSALRRRFSSLLIEALEPRLALAAVAAPPSLLADINPNDASSNPSAPVVIGNTAYFAANDGTNGVELWKTDGTPDGTMLVKDIQPGAGSSNPRSLTVFHGKLFFQASDGATGEDAHGDELWVSDGTEEGTQRVTDLATGTQSSFPDHMLVVNDKLFFTATNVDSGLTVNYGPSPYLSAADSPFDQSQIGTDFWLEDFEDGALNTPGVSADYGFARDPGGLTDSVDADDGQIDDNGLDGHSYLVRPAMTGVTFTFDRTVLGGLPSQVGIVLTGGGEDTPGVNVDFFDAAGNLISSANDPTPRPISGVTSDDRFVGLYHQGGISAMRISGPLGSANAGIEMDHLQYGAIVQPVGTMGLWYLDGIGAAPFKVTDLGYQPNFEAASVNRTLYFTGGDSATGVELWSYNVHSQFQVMDINPGAGSSQPRTLTPIDGTLYFVANDGVHGNELWKADADGASLVKDINSGAGGSNIPTIAVLNGTLLFSAGGLWRSDGTEEGTFLVKDIHPGANGSMPARFVNVNGTMFFTADNGTHSVELWKTDGTTDGTVLVTDLNLGEHSSGMYSLTNINGTLFLAAGNGPTGFELWQSDGTAEGTTLVADINPTGSSAPRNLLVVNQQLVFEANDGTHGWELFAAPLTEFQYSTIEDTLLTVDAAHGLLTQASGLPGTPVATVLNTAPAHGTVDIANDGSFQYQPDKDYTGLDRFTYKVTDDQHNSTILVVAVTMSPVNDAPIFVSGGDITVSDELAAAARVTNIQFNDLTGAPDNPFYNYTEGDFRVAAVSGTWAEAHDPSHITGHPAPAIYGTDYNGTLEINRISGGTFALSSFDLASWEFDFPATNSPVQYTVEGYLNGQLLYSNTGQVLTSQFKTIGGLPGALVDTLRFNMVRVDSQAYILDNIRIVTSPITSPVAPATVTFDGLKGLTGQGEPFVSYDEGEFNVSPRTGRWQVLATSSPSGVEGNPAPSIWEDTFTSSLLVSRQDYEQFTFAGLDLFGASVGYTFTGYLNGNIVLSESGVVPQAGAHSFVPIVSQSSAVIDSLKIELQRNDSEYSVVDNIRLDNIPWAKSISPGPADESSQQLRFDVSVDKPELFDLQPAIDAFGHLTFVPKANSSGEATVSVTLHDDGGTALGGVDTSPVQSFKINVVKQHLLHNVINSDDVDGDNVIAASDVVAVINYINAGRPGVMSGGQVAQPYGFLDVDADDSVSASDVIAIINTINATPPAPAADFVATDTTTQGSWIGKYGNDGYSLNSGPTSLPDYAQMSFKSGLTEIYDYVSAESTDDVQALQKPGADDRLFATWTGDYGFVLDLNLRGSQSHRVALYMYPGSGRSQCLEIINADTGDLLDTRTLEDFANGTYLVWNITGHVKIRFVNIANGLNAILNGVFFD